MPISEAPKRNIVYVLWASFIVSADDTAQFQETNTFCLFEIHYHLWCTFQREQNISERSLFSLSVAAGRETIFCFDAT